MHKGERNNEEILSMVSDVLRLALDLVSVPVVLVVVMEVKEWKRRRWFAINQYINAVALAIPTTRTVRTPHASPRHRLGTLHVIFNCSKKSPIYELHASLVHVHFAFEYTAGIAGNDVDLQRRSSRCTRFGP